MVAEQLRYGEPSQAGEFVYDHPFQWGSRRIGPDLAREGGLRGHEWHVRHFLNPNKVTVGSIMPPYPWLFEKKIDFESIPLRVAAQQWLGAPYEQYEGNNRDRAAEDAKAQAAQIAAEAVQQYGGQFRDNDGEVIDLSDKQATALIAYLQRLGTDLTAPPPAPEESTEPEPATDDSDESPPPEENG